VGARRCEPGRARHIRIGPFAPISAGETGSRAATASTRRGRRRASKPHTVVRPACLQDRLDLAGLDCWQLNGGVASRGHLAQRAAACSLTLVEMLDVNLTLCHAAQAMIGALSRQPRVLVVEDDERLVMAMSDVLVDDGYETRTATDGRAAIQRLTAGFSPDVIVLDLEMPHVNGFEFLDWLKQNGIEVPIVLSTLLDDYEGPELGAVGKLAKPFTLEQLLDGVAAALRVRPLRN
jgi:CheY-like chemotaxis protein